MSQNALNIIERIRLYKDQNPMAAVYILTDEAEAAELLTVLAATTNNQSKQELDEHRRKSLIRASNEYRKAVLEKRAMQYIQDMDQPLELYDLTITCPHDVKITPLAASVEVANRELLQ